MRTLLALLSLITLATAAPQPGDTILGKCVSVTDADTISLLVDKSVYKNPPHATLADHRTTASRRVTPFWVYLEPNDEYTKYEFV